MGELISNTALLLFLASIAGLIVGSFLNMLIYRLPIIINNEYQHHEKSPNLSLSKPNSFCPYCKHALKWFDNIPLIGFLIQRGHCRHCHKAINPSYLIVEIIAATLPLVLWYFYHSSLQWIVACIFAWHLLALIVIDLKDQLLPDLLTYTLLWTGLLASTLSIFVTPTTAIFGAITGYLSLFIIAKGYSILRGKDGLGYGDMKLLAAIGAFVGPLMLLSVILIGSLSALIVTIFMLSFKKMQTDKLIAFGPYLALGGFISLLFKTQILNFIFT